MTTCEYLKEGKTPIQISSVKFVDSNITYMHTHGYIHMYTVQKITVMLIKNVVKNTYVSLCTW